jgi:energy-converting hydrogenase A subunit D
MTDLFIALATLLTLIGGIATLVVRNPFDKLITLNILVSGTIIFMIICGYLDVAIVVSFMMPIGTFFILLLCRKRPKGLQ